MLRRFWLWLVGESEKDRKWLELMDRMLTQQQQMVDEQATTTRSVMEAMQTVGEASAKQAEVLQQYLKLFQTPEEPRRWALDEKEDNQTFLDDMNFPKDADESEQARFILDRMSSFYDDE